MCVSVPVADSKAVASLSSPVQQTGAGREESSAEGTAVTEADNEETGGAPSQLPPAPLL